MNDRYLYRAKRKNWRKFSKEELWIQGNLLMYANRKAAIFEELISDYGYECTEMANRTEVDPSTICQCSGKPDKNNNLIFENDLVNANGTVYVCRFDEDNFAWEFQNHEETIGICCFHSSGIEIIGNAIDNPELLEDFE